MNIYYPYSEYLKNKYGEKVYKLPVNLPGTCPNRDGTLSFGGCDYCADIGAGYESLDPSLSVTEQLEKNRAYIGNKYKANKFIAYFQNYTGTYLPINQLESYVKDALIQDVVAINISTRPDCIPNSIIQMLKRISEENNIDICIELGLQTSNDETLKRINRGHDTAQFIDAVLRIKQFDFSISAHVIPDFPFDTIHHVIQTARLLSALHIDGVKLHSLYIAKDSAFAKLYTDGAITLLSEEDYITRVITFLEQLSSEIYVERLLGRVPEENSLTANFNRSWWAIRDEIVARMEAKNTYQGIKCDYLDGSAHKKKYGI